MARIALTAVGAIATVLFAGMSGCVGGAAPAPQVREITFWIEQMPWELHPGVTTTVWAFCARGDGVEEIGDGPCSVPGPTIRVTEGDLLRITFENTHTIPHTVHFHGNHPFAADMNGAGFIDDALVVAGGRTATFEFIADPAGTFIYHCHFETPTHMEMGMAGAFIVEEREPDATPDEEFIAVLDEWAIHDAPDFVGSMPVYNYFTINGKSFPTTTPMVADLGDHVRIHVVNAGFEFHAMHLHGYVPDSWEGVAGPSHAVPTDVREIAPGQSVVLDFTAEREGIWLFHDHVVPRVTAAANGQGFGAYPRGMLTVLVVGEDYARALETKLPGLLAAAGADVSDPNAAHAGHDHAGHGHGAADHDRAPEYDGGVVVAMKDFAYAEPTLTVRAGTTVTWANQDPAGHTVTFDDGHLDSGDIAPGSSWSVRFDEPGTYTYHCAPHAAQDEDGAWRGMVATLVVEA